MSNHPDLAWLSENLHAQTDAFAKALIGVSPDATVPTCPQWRVRDLVGHIGNAHRWAAGLVRTGTATPPPNPRTSDPGAQEGWPSWLSAGEAELLGVLAHVPPRARRGSLARPARFVADLLAAAGAGMDLRRHSAPVRRAGVANLGAARIAAAVAEWSGRLDGGRCRVRAGRERVGVPETTGRRGRGDHRSLSGRRASGRQAPDRVALSAGRSAARLPGHGGAGEQAGPGFPHWTSLSSAGTAIA